LECYGSDITKGRIIGAACIAIQSTIVQCVLTVSPNLPVCGKCGVVRYILAIDGYIRRGGGAASTPKMSYRVNEQRRFSGEALDARSIEARTNEITSGARLKSSTCAFHVY
jgi:hypothetical protein